MNGVNYGAWDHHRVKEVRLAMGMTQEEFAHYMKVCFASASRWEHGHNVPHKLKQGTINHLHKRHCGDA